MAKETIREPGPLALTRDPSRLTGKRFDVLIVGGGINGAGLARDLSMRGLQVALVEKGDIASGTSSASTKLIHGGLRYLKQMALHLVFESCRERRVLQRIAPHLVRPMPFFVPVYRGDPNPLWMVRAGMALYDLLALFRNTGRHSILSAANALEREPALQREGLSGVALYWDCRMDDARLCLENVLAAAEAGAEVGTYLEVTGLVRRDGRVSGARLLDREGGTELEVEAQVVVNAAGPWLDRVCRLDEEGEERLRPTRGTHILVPRINRGGEALYLTAGRDDRLFFVIPWGEMSLVGTTDVDFEGDPDRVRPTAEDVDYLLEEAARHLRDVSLGREDVISAFAGLRPLVRQSGRTFGVSREHQIFESDSGLISVAGGKYTTYRSMAAEVADRVAKRLGRGAATAVTDRVPLPGGEMVDFTAFVAGLAPKLAQRYGLPRSVVERLMESYGSRLPRLLSLLDGRPRWAQPVCPGSELLAVQVVYAARYELARTPEDVLRRRTATALGPGRGLAELEAVAELLADCLGADAGRRRRWIENYRMEYTQPFL